MKKVALLGLALSTLNSVAAPTQALICVSKDYNPQKYDGQGLVLTLDNTGRLIKAQKMRGSWFGDTGVVNSPRVLANTPYAVVYDVNFKNDEYNGRVIFDKKDHAVVYQFSYADDERNRTASYLLVCRPVRR